MAASALELEHAIGYSSVKSGLFYHPNGREYLYAAGASIIVADFNDPHNQVFLQGHDKNIHTMALSKSGKYICSTQYGANADAVVWDYESKSLLYRLSEHDHGVESASFSDDELLLATVGAQDDGKLIVWDLSNGYIVGIVEAKPGPCTFVCWGGMVKDIKRRDTDMYQLATSGSKKVMLWSLNPYTGEMEGEPVMTSGTGTVVRDISFMEFSPDRETVYCGTTSGDFAQVNVKRKRIGNAIPACKLGANCLLSWPDGIIVGGGDGTVTTFDADMNDVAMATLNGAVKALSFSPDKVEVVAGTDRGFIYRLRLDSLQALLIAETHSAPVVAVSYPPLVSDKFSTISLDNTIRVWDASDYSVVTAVMVRDAGAPSSLVYTLDFLITGWSDGKIRAHDSDSGEPLWQIDNAHEAGVTALGLSNNQRYIISGGELGEVRIWELRSREMVSHLKEHTKSVACVVLYDDDVHALSCSRDRSFLCWDLRNEKRITSHVQRMGGMNCVALAKDQTHVLTVGQEKRLSFWDLREQHPVSITDLSSDMSDEGQVVAVSHAGNVVATAGSGMTIKVWQYSVEDVTLFATGSGHSGTILSLKFSADDKQLVSVGHDGLVLVWNLYAEGA